MPSNARTFLTLVVMTLILSATGCANKQDRHVFLSTVERPTTITLLDVYQNQSVWELDIPVNHKLVLNFENNLQGQTDTLGQAPSWVDWELYRADDQPSDTGVERKGKLLRKEKLDLTGTAVRMQVTYRPAPEMPGSLVAAPVPAVDTAESVAAEAAAEARAQTAITETGAPAEVEEVEEVFEEADAVVEEAAEVVEEVTEMEEATK